MRGDENLFEFFLKIEKESFYSLLTGAKVSCSLAINGITPSACAKCFSTGSPVRFSPTVLIHSPIEKNKVYIVDLVFFLQLVYKILTTDRGVYLYYKDKITEIKELLTNNINMF